ncbi:MAG TPA: cell division protein ZipA [Arenimonas sp.]|nr:cell division protein ZipA [Arenimonas sp.]
MSDTALLRVGIAVAAVVLFAVIYFTGRKKPEQGKRKPRGDGQRHEPSLREILEAETQAAGDAPVLQEELDLLEQTLAGEVVPNRRPAGKVAPGARPDEAFDKIVSLFLAARAGQSLHGPDLVVAAEKAGLVFGDKDIFHRLVDNHPEQGPIFSVANLVQPGSFDMAAIQELRTPGVSFFMTLPGPVSALDAWDAMLPTAQRMAELLDAVLLDEQRNALGRQRIANIRDELRAYDRQRDKLNIRAGR